MVCVETVSRRDFGRSGVGERYDGRGGDTFACWKLDRVGRSVQHLSKFVAELNARGIHFRTADGNADTSTSNGRLLLNTPSAIAEFERDLIIRTRPGRAWPTPGRTASASGRRSSGSPRW